MHEILDL